MGGSINLLKSKRFAAAMVQAYNFLASWQLFPEKGTYEFGDRPLSGIYRIEADNPSKTIIIHHNWMNLERQAFAAEYRLHAEPDLFPFENTALADQSQVTFPDGITFAIHFSRTGNRSARY